MWLKDEPASMIPIPIQALASGRANASAAAGFSHTSASLHSDSKRITPAPRTGVLQAPPAAWTSASASIARVSPRAASRRRTATEAESVSTAAAATIAWCCSMEASKP